MVYYMVVLPLLNTKSTLQIGTNTTDGWILKIIYLHQIAQEYLD